jgi:adenine-specific DNA methylase
MIGADWTGPPEFEEVMNKTDRLTHLLVSFSKITDNELEVNLIHTGWGNTEKWEQARLYFENAWIQVFKMLKSYLKDGNKVEPFIKFNIS